MIKKTTILLSILLAISMSVHAQIPNSGFENWTSVGTSFSPVSWGTFNNLTAPTNTFTCERGSPGYGSNYYMKLTSKTITGKGLLPGRAVSGKLDSLNFYPISGFPFNQRPAFLTGIFQYMTFGSSSHYGYIEVMLNRWDTAMVMSMPVAYAKFNLTGMQMSWDSISIPLTYYEGTLPDTCIITLSSSDNVPTDGDYLYVDNLAFNGYVAGIKEIGTNANFSLYPNPAREIVQINFDHANNDDAEIKIFNATGDLLKHESPMKNQHQINIADLANGVYVIEITTSSWSEKQRLIIQK